MRIGERPRALALLAEEDRFAGAPARVEARLRAKVRGRAWWRVAWIAGPVTVAAALVLVWMARIPREVSSMEIAKFAPAVPEMALTAPARVAAEAAPVRRPVGVGRAEAAKRFYELAYASPELLANSQVVRVRVPRAALLSFGLSLDAYRPVAGSVEADVIITEDGIARAIRFVPPSQYSYQGVH